MKFLMALLAVGAGVVAVNAMNGESPSPSEVARAGESWEAFLDRHRVQSVGDPASESYDREKHLEESRRYENVDPYKNLSDWERANGRRTGGVSGSLAELRQMTNDAYYAWIQTKTTESYQKYISVKAAYEAAERQGTPGDYHRVAD